jgi:uncharacterized protein (DUF924 family)
MHTQRPRERERERERLKGAAVAAYWVTAAATRWHAKEPVLDVGAIDRRREENEDAERMKLLRGSAAPG